MGVKVDRIHLSTDKIGLTYDNHPSGRAVSLTFLDKIADRAGVRHGPVTLVLTGSPQEALDTLEDAAVALREAILLIGTAAAAPAPPEEKAA